MTPPAERTPDTEGGDGDPPRPPGGIGYHRGGRATFTREGASRDRAHDTARRPARGLLLGVVIVAAIVVVVGWLLVM